MNVLKTKSSHACGPIGSRTALSLLLCAVSAGGCTEIYIQRPEPEQATGADAPSAPTSTPTTTAPATAAPATTATVTTTSTSTQTVSPDELLWTRQVSSNVSPVRLLTLADGSVVVAGRLDGTAVFGRGEAGQVTLSPSNCAGTTCGNYLARYRSDGRLAWAKRFGGDIGNVLGAAVLTDGSLAVTATYCHDYTPDENPSNAAFGVGEAGETVLPLGKSFSLFVARYSAEDGSLRWVRRSDVTSAGEYGGYVQAEGVAPAPDGGVTVCGAVLGDAMTANVGAPGQRALSVSGFSALLLDLAADGTLRSARIPSFTWEFLDACAYLPGGDLVAGGANLMAARFDAAGGEVWNKSPSVSGWWYTDGVRVLPDGGAVAFGRFDDGTMTFGAGEPSETRISCGPHEGVPTDWCGWVARLRSDGSLAWAYGADDAWPISVDVSAGSVLIALTSVGGSFGVGSASPLKLPGSATSTVLVAVDAAKGAVEWSRRVFEASASTSAWLNDVAFVAARPDGSLVVAGGLQGRSPLVVLPDSDKPQHLSSAFNDLFLTALR